MGLVFNPRQLSIPLKASPTLLWGTLVPQKEEEKRHGSDPGQMGTLLKHSCVLFLFRIDGPAQRTLEP